MAKLLIEIDKCYECPFSKCERKYTPDPFEFVWDYKCGRNNSIIETDIEKYSGMPEIPSWCPIRTE